MSVSGGGRLTGLWRRASLRRLGWGVADQAVSSIENFVLGVVVARLLGAASLGALALALLTYAIAVNAARGLATDPLMVRYSGPPDARWHDATKAATGTALVVGVVGAVLLLGLAAVLHAVHGAVEAVMVFVALAVGLPGLVVQDSWRYAFFTAGQGGRAFGNDLFWTLLLFGVLAVTASRFDSAVGPVLAFGGTATVAAVFGAWQARARPAPLRTRAWVAEHRDLGTRFLVENVTLGASASARSYAVAGTSGLSAAGGVRGAEMLVGPVSSLLMGIAQVAVPEVARRLRKGRSAFRAVCLGLSGGLAGVSLAWGVILLVLFPLGLGELVLGHVWPSAAVLVPAVVLAVTFDCLSIGAPAGLRVLGRADRTMPTQFVASGMFIGFGVAGALLGGAVGTVWGTAVAAGLACALWWFELLRAEETHFAVTPDGPRPATEG